MKGFNSLKRQVREMEKASGAGAVTITNADGSTEGFNLSQNGRLKVLIASLDIAHAAYMDVSTPEGTHGNPDAKPRSTPRAIEVARKIAHAEQVSPPGRLWNTVTGIVRQAESINTEPDTREAKGKPR